MVSDASVMSLNLCCTSRYEDHVMRLRKHFFSYPCLNIYVENTKNLIPSLFHLLLSAFVNI